MCCSCCEPFWCEKCDQMCKLECCCQEGLCGCGEEDRDYNDTEEDEEE